MERSFILRIKKYSVTETALGALVLLPFLVGILPGYAMYACDILWAGLLVLFLSKRMIAGKEMRFCAVILSVFILYTLALYLFHLYSPLYYLWGIRNNFRFYAAFVAFGGFVTTEQAGGILKLFDILFWCNAVISLVQFFFFDISGDSLGGIFGSFAGGNSYTVIFFCIVLAFSALSYLTESSSAGAFFAKYAATVIVSALAELKFMFAVFGVITLLALLLTRATPRKLFLVILTAIAVTFGSALVAQMFSVDTDWFTIRWMLDTLTDESGYTSSGDLNRLTAITEINETIFASPWQRLFGMGLGNCDTASYDILVTPFFNEYGNLHYTWISYAFMYLETGYMGLLFYFGFFVFVYFSAARIGKVCSEDDLLYCNAAKIMAVVCAILAFYNSSLRTEAAYMAYFVLALPFAVKRKVLDLQI